MRAVVRFLCLLALSFSIAAAGVPLESEVPPETPRCCLLMKQDGCEQQPVNPADQQRCCAACVIGLALPADAAKSFVHDSTGDEVYASLDVRARAREDRPEIPPPRFAS